MESENIFESLLESRIIEETANGELKLSKQFNKELRQREAAGAEAVIENLSTEKVPSDHIDRIKEIAAFDPEFVTHYGAVDHAIDDREFETVMRATVLLEQFEARSLPTEGSPDSFAPVRGEKLPTVLSVFPVAVVYIWREGSTECATMKRDLNKLLNEPPEDVALFSVYGPDSAAFLEEIYDVIGGPTTLFVVDGEVDSRLYGAQFPEVIDREITELRETAEMRGVL